MKFNAAITAAAALALTALAAPPALALEPGSVFTTLPTSTPLRKFDVISGVGADLLRINEGPVSAGAYTTPSFLTLLASSSTDVELGGEEVGEVHDYVFRDTRDNMLVFGTRIELALVVDGEQNDFEVNDLFRRGFTGYSAAVAWTKSDFLDLRLYSAARTATGLKQGADVFSPDVIDLRSDVNVSESNPFSALFLIKTNAPNWKVAADAIGVYQAGEENQAIVLLNYAGFAPAPVPEPSTYALMFGGLGLMAIFARRRRRGMVG